METTRCNGRYKLIRMLGSKGFGKVWMVEDAISGIHYAMKEIISLLNFPYQRIYSI